MASGSTGKKPGKIICFDHINKIFYKKNKTRNLPEPITQKTYCNNKNSDNITRGHKMNRILLTISLKICKTI